MRTQPIRISRKPRFVSATGPHLTSTESASVWPMSGEPASVPLSDATTGATVMPVSRSPEPGVSRTESISRRTSGRKLSAVRRTNESGALPTLNVSAATDRRIRRTRMTTSPNGDAMRALYVQARRRREAPYRRAEVFARWGGQCCYCDAPAEHLDHVRPLSRGGRDVLSNVVPACAECNLGKAALTLAEWAMQSTRQTPITTTNGATQ